MEWSDLGFKRRSSETRTPLQGAQPSSPSQVQEKGTNLSAGTVQLLCLARVLLRQPALIFMDEGRAGASTSFNRKLSPKNEEAQEN